MGKGVRESQLSKLTAGIYAAAVDPDRWPTAMGQIADAVGAYFYAISGTRPDVPALLPNMVHPQDLGHIDVSVQEFAKRNQFAIEGEKLGIVSGDVYVPERTSAWSTMVRSAFFNEVLRPIGFQHGIIGIIRRWPPPPGSEEPLLFHVSLILDRSPKDQQIGLVEQLLPHFQRAVDIHQMLGAERAMAAMSKDALDLLTVAVCFVGDDGRLLHANASAQALLLERDGLRYERGRWWGATATVTAELQRLIGVASLLTESPQDVPASPFVLRLPRSGGRAPLLATVAPLDAHHHPALASGSAGAMLALVDPEQRPQAPEELLRALFGFTAQECRVALELAHGLSPQEIADQHQVSIETVRTQIKQVREKAGVRRSAQVVRLVLQATIPIVR